MRNVTFPQLGLEFNFDPVAFRIGSVSIRWYALIIAAGFLLAVIYCFKRARRFGVDNDRLTDIVLGGLIGGIVGARLYYVLFKLDYYAANPLKIFEIWEGGLAIYGGLIGAILVAFVIARLRKIRFAPVLDVASLGFLIGQGVGRWANFINAEAFGSNTTLPWGMHGTSVSSYLALHLDELNSYGIAVDPNVPVHPTFLYESLWCLAGFVIFHFLSKRRKFDGEIFIGYSVWYGIGRFLIEGLRTDSLMLGKVRISQLLAAVIVIAAVAFWLVIRAKIRKDPSSKLAVLYVDTDESREAVNGKKGKKKTEAPAETEEAGESSEEEEAPVQSGEPDGEDDLQKKKEDAAQPEPVEPEEASVKEGGEEKDGSDH